MKRRGRKILIIALIAVGCIAAVCGGIYYGLIATMKSTTAAWENIRPIDLTQIATGVYNGRAGAFICSADLDVTVRDHRIVDINVRSEVNGGGKFRAEGLIKRMIDAQSPDVDAVSGATLTSRTMMVAVYEALRKSPRR